ncbi:ABC transporter substrate-binding protein [Kluyvera ascorbata]|nr:ABC transporter substrate-binding protein [Kluyvera ascorbata]
MRNHGETRRHLRFGLLGMTMLLPLAAHADSWQQIQNDAKGQTVWFNAWGGDEAINHYLDWVSGEVKRDYAVDLRIVHIADAADTVKRIQTEARAGRKTNGSVDLLWVNGENFRALKEASLLRTGWAEQLPNWRYVDVSKPVREDFSVPVDGAESPWGSAQLTFIARQQQTSQPPTSPQALLEFAAAHPGTVTYPRPPDFTGTALLEQLLINVTTDPDALKQPPNDQTFAAVTAPLWAYLDKLHPLLWRQGKDFPPSPARMDTLLTNGTLRLSLTFNPMHATQKVAKGELPKDSYSFGFTQGMIGNVHFVTIPANASASAGAQVVANFLLSPQAQLRKADPAIWGDPSVLDAAKLDAEQQQTLQKLIPENTPPVLAEPHSAWVNVLEQEWLRRYGTH